jgi:hypothetical protein
MKERYSQVSHWSYTIYFIAILNYENQAFHSYINHGVEYNRQFLRYSRFWKLDCNIIVKISQKLASGVHEILNAPYFC